MVPKKSQFSPKVPDVAFVELFWGRSQIPNPVLKRLLISLTCVPSARIHWPLVMPKNSVKNYAIAKNMDWSVYVIVIYLVCSVVKMSLFHPPISEHCWKLFCTGGVTRQQAFMHRFEIWRKIIWPTMKKPKYPKPETRVLYFFRLSSLIPLMICSTAVNQGTSPNQSI